MAGEIRLYDSLAIDQDGVSVRAGENTAAPFRTITATGDKREFFLTIAGGALKSASTRLWLWQAGEDWKLIRLVSDGPLWIAKKFAIASGDGSDSGTGTVWVHEYITNGAAHYQDLLVGVVNTTPANLAGAAFSGSGNAFDGKCFEIRAWNPDATAARIVRVLMAK